MPQATNLISIDDSMQAEALGSACLVAIIGTINMLILTATPLTVIRRLRLPSSNPSHWHTR